jgi:hypothetical protein
LAAPVAVNVTGAPEHTLVLDAAMVTVGLGFTVSVIVVEPVQPADRPVTVYCCVAGGLTVNGLDVEPPGFQV